MVLDHALLFTTPESNWASTIRCTATRCAEPLFVFTLTALVLVRDRPVRIKRLLQLAAVAIASSTILSKQLGYPLADILVSLIVVAPLIRSLTKLPAGIQLWLVYPTACLAMIPVSVASVAVDYSPFLIAHQILVTGLLLSGTAAWVPLAGSALVSLATVALMVKLGVEPSSSVLIVVIGHPLAVLMVRFLQGLHIPDRWISAVAAWPLSIYLGHLTLLAVIL